MAVLLLVFLKVSGAPKGAKNARANVGVSCSGSTIAIAVQNTTLLFEINPRFSFKAASLPNSTQIRTYVPNLAAKVFEFFFLQDLFSTVQAAQNALQRGPNMSLLKTQADNQIKTVLQHSLSIIASQRQENRKQLSIPYPFPHLRP